MNTNQTETGERTPAREQWITERALRMTKAQGYSEETGYAFAAFAIEHLPRSAKHVEPIRLLYVPGSLIP